MQPGACTCTVGPPRDIQQVITCLSMHGSVYRAALCALHMTYTDQAAGIACQHLHGSFCMSALRALPALTSSLQVGWPAGLVGPVWPPMDTCFVGPALAVPSGPPC